MMTLVTGLPGRGKTLYAVQLVREAVNVGRKVYCDIEGLKVPVEPIGDDFDWRDTPPGSLVVFDEAHRRFPSSGKGGPSKVDQVNALDTHRHTGHDFVYVTQYPRKVDRVIRELVDRHVHLVRAFGLQGALIHEWGFCQASPESPSARREADKQRWKYPRGLYKLYKSASMHSRYNALQLPGRAWLFPVGAVVLLALLWLAVSSWSARMTPVEPVPAVSAVTSELASRPADIERDAGVGIRGCYAVFGMCRCFGELGVVQVAGHDCRRWSQDPWAVQPVPYTYVPPPPYVPPLGVIGATTGGDQQLSGGS